MKFLLIAAVIFFVGFRLISIDWTVAKIISIEHTSLLAIAIVLLSLNWGLEFLKWKITVIAIGGKSSSRQLLASLMAGISSGLVTPNRIGNFIGRMLYFSPQSRANVILGSLYGNLAQFLASVIIGLPGLFFMGTTVFKASIHPVLLVIACVMTLLLTIGYFVFPFMKIRKWTFLVRRFNLILRFQRMSRKLVAPLFILSVLRYIVFAIQYILVLMAFGAPAERLLVYGVLLTFLITTLIPGFVLGKLLVRETVALSVLSAVVGNPVVIIFSSLLVWVINLGFPGLIGLVFLYKVKVK
jgi:uncharacterized membrane protein YbhN (UPF0104 family)